MSMPKDISDTLIGLYKRRPGTFRKWLPVAYWIQKMQLEGLTHGKLQCALETCSTHKTNVKDSTHGHLCIEITMKRLKPPLGNKPFICCSTPSHPNLYVGNYDKTLFGKALQASWDRWASKEDDNEEMEEALETEQEQAPVQATPSPPQPTTATPSPPKNQSDNPQFKAEDEDLLAFFRSIMLYRRSTLRSKTCSIPK